MKNLEELYEQAGFSNEASGKWPSTLSIGSPLEKLIRLVVDECATAAKEHARTYADGDAGTGAYGAARAVQAYGDSLLKE